MNDFVPYDHPHHWLFEHHPYVFGSAATYTTDTTGRPLLLKSHTKGWQFLAGGMMDPGETPWETAVRETREETGRVLTGAPVFLGAAFRPATDVRPPIFVFFFDGGVMTDEEIEAIVLEPREHTDYAARTIDEWKPLLPSHQYELMVGLDEARRNGRPAYQGIPI